MNSLIIGMIVAWILMMTIAIMITYMHLSKKFEDISIVIIMWAIVILAGVFTLGCFNGS